MRFSLALLGAVATIAAANPQSYTQTVVLTTVSYYTQTVAPSSSSSSSSSSVTSPCSSSTVSIYKTLTSETPAPVYTPSTSCSTLKTSAKSGVPYYSATGVAPIPLSPSTYITSLPTYAVPTYTATAVPSYYTGAASRNAGAYGGAVAFAAVVVAMI